MKLKTASESIMPGRIVECEAVRNASRQGGVMVTDAELKNSIWNHYARKDCRMRSSQECFQIKGHNGCRCGTQKQHLKALCPEGLLNAKQSGMLPDKGA